MILISGLYSTKLDITINCKKLAKKNIGRRLIEVRLYCQDTICEDEEEEHVIFSA